MTFLPPRPADSENPIFFFSGFWGLGHLQGLGVRLGRILGVLAIEPFLGEGGVRPEGSIDLPPPRKRKPGLPLGTSPPPPPLAVLVPFLTRCLLEASLDWRWQHAGSRSTPKQQRAHT